MVIKILTRDSQDLIRGVFVAQQRVIRSKSSLYGDDGAQSNPAELDFHVESIISSNNSIGSTCISIANLKGVGPIAQCYRTDNMRHFKEEIF